MDSKNTAPPTNPIFEELRFEELVEAAKAATYDPDSKHVSVGTTGTTTGNMQSKTAWAGGAGSYKSISMHDGQGTRLTTDEEAWVATGQNRTLEAQFTVENDQATIEYRTRQNRTDRNNEPRVDTSIKTTIKSTGETYARTSQSNRLSRHIGATAAKRLIRAAESRKNTT